MILNIVQKYLEELEASNLINVKIMRRSPRSCEKFNLIEKLWELYWKMNCPNLKKIRRILGNLGFS